MIDEIIKSQKSKAVKTESHMRDLTQKGLYINIIYIYINRKPHIIIILYSCDPNHTSTYIFKLVSRYRRT